MANQEKGNQVLVDEKELKELRHFKDSNTGLWAIDRNPNDVNHEWIKEHSFQIS
jgi:hypothetical protein